MSFYLIAPYELPQTVSMYPSPDLMDSRSAVSEVLLKEALDGSVVTHKKTTSRQLLSFSFTLDFEKVQELQAFFNTYMQYPIRIIDHKDAVWRGFFKDSNLNIAYISRNRATVSLNIEAEKING